MALSYTDDAFVCNECKSPNLLVKDTRKFEGYMIRKRVCSDCGAYIRTIEVSLDEYNELWETVHGEPRIKVKGRRLKEAESFVVKTDEGITEVAAVLPKSSHFRTKKDIEEESTTVYSTDAEPKVLIPVINAEYTAEKRRGRKPKSAEVPKSQADPEIKKAAKEYNPNKSENNFTKAASLVQPTGEGGQYANKISLTKRSTALINRMREDRK